MKKEAGEATIQKLPNLLNRQKLARVRALILLESTQPRAEFDSRHLLLISNRTLPNYP